MSLDSHPDSPGLSPTISRLLAAVELHGVQVVDPFWADLCKGGTPLVEELPEQGPELLVTFLWRPEERFQQAFVSSSLFQPGPMELELTRIPGSDLWFRTVRLPRRLRGAYSFFPGPTPRPQTEQTLYEWIWRTERADPHHAGAIRFPKIPTDPDDHEVVRSVLELPGAVPQPYVEPRSGVAHGRFEPHDFPSTILGAVHPVWIYLPPGYGTDPAPCDLAVMFDGRAYWNAIPTPTIMDNLLADGVLDPTIVVLWDYPRSDLRNLELECNPRFADCMEQELIPWLRSNYRVTTDPGRTVLAGASAGGLGATYVAWRYSSTFGKVLSQSGWFSCAPSGVRGPPGWMPAQFAEGPSRPIEFYLEAGSTETGPSPAELEILPSNRAFQRILESKRYIVHYGEFEGGHDYVNWRGTLANGLQALLPRKPIAR